MKSNPATESFVIHPRLGPALPSAGWVPAPRYLLRRARIRTYVERLAPTACLDIGCGPAALLYEWRQRGIDAHGLEMSAHARALAHALLDGTGARLHENPEPDWAGRFPLVCAFEVLEHIEDDRAALRQWNDWIAPGGHLLLSVPAHPSRFNAADRWAGHFRRYTREELAGKLRESGLQVQAIECYGFPLANLLEGPRAFLYGRQLKNQQDAPEIGGRERTEQSGTNRAVDSRFWPVLASPPASGLLWCCEQLQRAFLKTNLGNGFLALARKPEAPDED